MYKNSLVLQKSKVFALKIVDAYKYLVQNREYIITAAAAQRNEHWG